MDPQKELLLRVEKVRGSWKRLVWCRGLAVVLGVAVTLLVLAATISDFEIISPGVVVALRVGLFIAISITIFVKLFLPLRNRPNDQQIAQFVEEKHPRLDCRLITAIEVSAKPRSEQGPFGALLIRDALDRSRHIRFEDVVNRKKMMGFATLSVAFLSVLLGVLYFSNVLLPSGSARLFAGFLEPPSRPDFVINVVPGDVTVPQGGDVLIEAVTSGFDPERAEIYLRYENSSQWETSTMDVAPVVAPTFRHLLFNVQEPLSYFVEANGFKSREFVIRVADLPRVESLDLAYNYPRYTGLTDRIEEDAIDVVAVRGTVVDVRVQANQELSSGRFIFSDGDESKLTPSGKLAGTGQLILESNTTFRVELTNTMGQKHLSLQEYAVEVLEDQKPFLEFVKPGRDQKASTVEEVFTELRAEDDLGINGLKLHFSVNGREEQEIDLFSSNGRSPREVLRSYTFFLEEFEIQPGDFITYFGEAVDSGRPANTVMTDIYFIEVRPFDREYFQSQSGGLPGMGSQADRDDSAEALSRRQKEIISATFNLIRDRKDFDPSEYSDNIRAVAESQSTLVRQTETLMMRLMRRQLVVQDRIAQLSEYMRNALVEMGPAVGELKQEKLSQALPYEQRALQFLMRAETLFNEIQVSMGGSGGRGEMGGSAEDLADLFDLELDQNKNQYETLNRGETSQNSQELDEALRRLKELAQRQQNMIDQKRRSGQRDGDSSQQMSADDLRRETERLARRLERLSRENNDRNMGNVSRGLQEAARKMREARGGGGSGEGKVLEEALKELQRAEQLLAGIRGGSLEERLTKLERQARHLLNQQGQIVQRVDRLVSESNQGNEQRSSEVRELKEEAMAKLLSLERELDSLQTSQSGRDTANRVRSAMNVIRSGRLLDKMNQGQQLLDNGYFDYAAQREHELEEALGELVAKLKGAIVSASNTKERQAQNLLNRTSEVIRSLESMQRQLQDQENFPQAGEGGQEGLFDRDPRQLKREWEERFGDVREIRDQLSPNDALRTGLNRIMNSIRRRMEQNYPGDKVEVEAILREIINPFRSIELALSRELQLLMGEETIRLANEEEIPAGYKRLVEEYYKKLSNGRPGPN